jgi:hypothetical protein
VRVDGHHPIKPKRNRRRRGLQLGHDPAPRSAPPRQGIDIIIVGRAPVNQLSAISSRARGPRRIRPELWVEPPPISFCQILFDRIGGDGAICHPFLSSLIER